ncbi:hypothetical protein C2G38_2229118 [Gigaspora rosea]|uniref:DNA-directed DNA polymerase n=1 Tax=Gigaspora rosea TaxID=44941 RepID=A0A397TYU2_9GLOM|nr:hypothetical protein C2G38_2229118 [Gigaspora rosea]
MRDRTLILTWGIKTQSRELGEFAKIHDEETFALYWKAFIPDIQFGFSDSKYDWPFIIERACRLNLLEWMWKQMTGSFKSSKEIQKWNYYGKIGVKSKNSFQIKKGATDNNEEENDRTQSIIIKISSEDNYISIFFKIPGCVPIDVRACFMKLYPRAEVDKKKVKESISLNKSHPSTIQNMCEVAHYCIIDALCCQELMVKRNVINDYREVASIAYVSLFDSHYRANGMKVRNLLGAYANKHNILFSTRQCKNIEKGEYPGIYVFPPKKGIETKRPVTGLDFASLYPSLIMAYNLSPEKMILTYREADIGLYPIVLEDLFNKRVNLKAQLASLGKKKKHLGKMISLVKEKGKKIPESLNSEYSSICFDYNCLNSKQFALKVYMNTFYGEAGNSKSPFFFHELAGGITPVVKITMDVMKKLRDQVNAYLRIKNSTSYLKMVYEEVLFPVCFTGKKKYFGVPHEEVVNFKPDNLFKKGIDTVKQDQSQLFKFIGEKIMWEAIDINNTRSVHKIVEDTLIEVQNKEWDFNEFIIMGTWRPKKKNLCNNRFIERMRERNERIPNSVGDFMKYANIAKEFNMEIDINYYLEKTVARFIIDDNRYQPPSSHKIMQLKDLDEKEKQIDAYSQKEAKKWLTKYIKALN